MDLLVTMPMKIKKHDTIWVIVERLTKSARFLLINLTDPLDRLA